MWVLVGIVVIASLAATVFGVRTTLRAIREPLPGADGPRQARRMVFGIGLSLAAITTATLVIGLVGGHPTLVAASLVIGLEEAWEWFMLTALLRNAERVELSGVAG